MKDVFIVGANRSPFGKIGGKLSPVRPDDLLATVLKDLVSKINFPLVEIDDVLIGCSNQAGEDNRNVGRMSSLLAGIPQSVPANTINRLCGSSLDAVLHAYSRISSGMDDCIIAGGVESMSRGPLVISKAGNAFDRQQKMYDSTFGWRFPNPKMEELFPLLGMGQTAENLVEKFNISREDQDNYALASHQKAELAYSKNLFSEQIVPIKVQLKKSEYIVDKDECIRADSNLESLQKLRAVFKQGGSVTAGNSSPMNDGASSLLIVSEDFLKKHQLTPILRISGAAVAGLDPSYMGLGPVEATNKLLKKSNLTINDFDTFELNEAFAVQVLACTKELNISLDKVNPWGGAISIGHPLGASGARLMTHLFHQFKQDTHLKRGLASMCIGVGQGISISVEKA